MHKKILFCFICLLLLVGCTAVDSTLETEKGNRTALQRRSSTQSTDTAESETTEPGDSALGYNVEDFLGATKIVPYSGWISQTDIDMSSSLSEYWESEADERSQTFYSFDAIRVYFENGVSNFYLVQLTARTYYNADSYQKQRVMESETSSIVGPGFVQVSGKPEGHVTIGKVDYDGEIYFSVYPSLVSDEGYTTMPVVTVLSDGTKKYSTLSLDIPSLSAGGGSKTPCQADSSDRVISGPHTCLTYISADGTFSGTYSDSISDSDAEGSSTSLRTISWDLYPLDIVEDDVPIGNEEPLGDADYSSIMEEFSSYDEGFSDWIISTY